MNNEVKKYPKEIYSNIKNNSTFSINGALVKNDGISPYKVYDDNFSRFIFTVISKNNGNTIYPSSNISEREIHGLIAKSKIAQSASIMLNLPIVDQLFSSINQNNTNTNKQTKRNLPVGFGKKANSVQIANGMFKGKTPIQVLKEDKNNVDKLQNQLDWLNKNLDRYPNNKKQMDAIKEALYMAQNNMLDNVQSSETVSGGNIQLYTPTPRALIRKKDPNTGLCPVYELSIDWTIGDKYPVSVTVKNYLAPVTQNQNGTLNPNRAKAINKQYATHRLTDIEWANCVYKLEMHMRRFENLWAKSQFQEAERLEKEMINQIEN